LAARDLTQPIAQPAQRIGAVSERVLSGAVLFTASLLGLGAFLYPFFMPAVSPSGMMAHAGDAPLVFVLLVVLCLAVVFASLSGREMTSKFIAVLGMLTAVNAVLRTVPGPAGFSAVFVLPILAGYAYGPAFGFLLGALSIFVSALIGGGVGPWLPYQMFATGWMGMLSGWLPDMKRIGRWEPVVLAVWGVALGFIFGAIMNIWFWPFLAGGSQPDQSWQPGMPIWQTVRNYAVFYAVTSLWWDMARAVGNAMLILFFAAPILRVLRRFKRRFRFDIAPLVSVLPPETLTSAEN
jgi:energy-coupling factor transport system substrate-specific component